MIADAVIMKIVVVLIFHHVNQTAVIADIMIMDGIIAGMMISMTMIAHAMTWMITNLVINAMPMNNCTHLLFKN